MNYGGYCHVSYTTATCAPVLLNALIGRARTADPSLDATQLVTAQFVSVTKHKERRQNRLLGENAKATMNALGIKLSLNVGHRAYGFQSR